MTNAGLLIGRSLNPSMPKHIPVLLKESVEGLNLEPNKLFVDGTYGAGGHTSEVLRRFPEVKVIAIDQDPAISKSETLNPKIEFKTGNFRDLDTLIGNVRPDAILLDIGISSDQLAPPPSGGDGRGFSFLRTEPLDMRMSGTGPTAAEIVNSWDESAIELILRGFDEEGCPRHIAREIVETRRKKKLETTTELVEAVNRAKPRQFRERLNPATKTFQALRIATNSELDALEEGLVKSFDKLKTGGRLAVISFHSLEDRIVKNFFREKAGEGKAKLINKKPIIPTEAEITENPRSRSAKLRIVEKVK